MKTTHKILVTLPALLLVAILALLGWSFWRDPAAAVVAVEMAPEEPWRLGDVLECNLVVEMPWYRLPSQDVRMETPEGLQAIGEVERRLVGVGLGVWRWRVSRQVQPYDLGTLRAPEMSVELTASRTGNADMVRGEFKPVRVQPRLAGRMPGQLATAPGIANPIETGKHTWFYWVGLGVLSLLILLVMVAILLRKEGVGAGERPSLEQMATHHLNLLAAALPMRADAFFVRLTDIMRGYIERKFNLRATEKTTPEFLRDVEQDSRLDEGQRRMLQSFLTSADMVKFARQSATQEQMQDALTKAREFVESQQDEPADFV